MPENTSTIEQTAIYVETSLAQSDLSVDLPANTVRLTAGFQLPNATTEVPLVVALVFPKEGLDPTAINLEEGTDPDEETAGLLELIRFVQYNLSEAVAGWLDWVDGGPAAASLPEAPETADQPNAEQ